MRTSMSVGSVQRPTFLEVPAQKWAYGVLTFLRRWGRQGEKLAGMSGHPTHWSLGRGSVLQSSAVGK